MRVPHKSIQLLVIIGNYYLDNTFSSDDWFVLPSLLGTRTFWVVKADYDTRMFSTALSAMAAP